MEIGHFSPMEIVNAVPPDTKSFQGGSVLFGNFDGLHLGHQALVNEAIQLGGPVVVLTFDPHPLQVLRPEVKRYRLFPPEDLAEQLAKFGVDLLVRLNFDHSLSQVSALDFWRNFIVKPFHPKNLVVGYDVGFGKGREGGVDELRKWASAEQISLHFSSPVKLDGEIVSSGRIRENLLVGDVEKASRLLGRNFYLRGRVINGDGRGRGLGYPTLNIEPQNEITPALGVYATWTLIQGRKWMSVSNLGTNPTFSSSNDVKFETHIIEAWDPVDLSNDKIDVEFVSRIRDERAFSSSKELVAQIRMDVESARKSLAESQLSS